MAMSRRCPFVEVRKSAFIDSSGQYRYWLTREWNDGLPRLGICMLNPSTADHEKDDQTLRKCIGFAKSWEFGSLKVVNLFALRSSSPKALKHASDPVGPLNAYAILEAASEVETMLVAWGSHGGLMDRDRAVLDLLKGQPLKLVCLGKTKFGKPKHPLYISGSAQFIQFIGNRHEDS